MESVPFSFSSSFNSKGDLTSWLASIKINSSVPCFDNNDTGATYNVESVNSAYCEGPTHAHEHNYLNLNIKFEPFILTFSKDEKFEHSISNSSFTKGLVATSSNK